MDPIDYYIAYLEKLASEHVDIRHKQTEEDIRFFGPTWDDFILRGHSPPVLIYLHPFVETGSADNLQITEMPVLGFSILKPNHGNDDDEVTRRIYSECKAILRTMLWRMRKDRREKCEPAMQYAQLKDYSVHLDGPHGEGYVGCAVRIPLRYSLTGEHEPDKWIQPD